MIITTIKGKSTPKPNKLKCFLCHKQDHSVKTAQNPFKQGEEKKDKGEISVAQDGYESGDILCMTNHKNDQSWILDNGCSFHMSSNKNWFMSFEESSGGQVFLGNNKTCKVQGIGSIKLVMHDGLS